MTGLQRGLRALLFLATALVSAGAISSCSALIGADDYEGSADALCGALAVCYSLEGCDDRVSRSLELAPSTMRAEWLKNFSDFDCLSGCAAARRCLDFEPVCAIQGACSKPEECCGFIAGKADCVGNSCCRTRGVACQNNADCCENDCSTITNTCGGVVCIDVGQPCVDSFECCTQICENGVCAPEVCRPPGFECQDANDCCSLICDQGKCGEPQCAPVGAECVGDLGPISCCDSLHQCVPSSVGSAFCSDCPGLPLGAPCDPQNDVECCSGNCDDEFRQCAIKCPGEGDACDEQDCCEGVCTDPGTGGPPVCKCHNFDEDCSANSDCCRGRCDLAAGKCACSEDLCSTNEDCCSGTCIGGACALKCATVACHDECKLGAPLDQGQCTAAPNESSCIQAVCSTDPYCCCQAWDDLCVETAKKDTVNCLCN